MLNEPAIDKEFFGRGEVLRLLEKRVTALKGGYRQNVALTGQMLSGKSSILYQFLYSLKDTSIIPIYIEVIDEPFRSFADKFIATVLYNYLLSCEKEVKNDLEFLLAAAEPLIPVTVLAVREIKKDLSVKGYTAAYRKLLGLTSVLRQETGKSCVVILDEFHNLERFKIKKPYMHFGKIIMIQKDTMYIVSSSKKSAIRKILSEKLALLYGNFEVIEISGFDHATSRAFLEEKLSGLALEEGLSDYLIDFTDGNPFYITVIARKIKELAGLSRDFRVGLETLVDAITALVYAGSGTINQYLANMTVSLLGSKEQNSALDTLAAIAYGFNKTGEMAVWLGKSKGVFLKTLIELTGLDLVSKYGLFYEINDVVLKFWIKNVLHKRKTLPVGDITERESIWRATLRRDIAEHFHEKQKGIPRRVEELFSSFAGEIVGLGKKVKKLPRFSAVEIRNSLDGAEILASLPKGKYWVSRVMEKRINEPLICDFIKRYNPMRDKIARRVCIAFGGIDENALLLAKEKNIWVWDKKTLNALLRLYKRRVVICS
ncbi:MAG: ATP-binding protein [Candidatus Omnitrophica bacterium]|nr:ATP-binding protein [Candidatus Omnitrophota bacterium]